MKVHISELPQLAQSIAKTLNPGAVVGFKGEMGAGKTTLIKEIVSALGGDQNIVVSPTFTIVNQYQADHPIYHLDLYRLPGVESFLNIDGEDYLHNTKAITLIEWPDLIESIVPSSYFRLDLEYSDQPDMREINWDMAKSAPRL